MSATGYKIADGTDLLTTFQNVLTANGNTFSSPSNVFYGNGSNLTGCTGPANMVTTDTVQTITGLKTFSGATGGIKLTNCCITGRSDGFGFTGFAGLTTQPIGYTINHLTGATSLPTSGTTTNFNGLPTLDAGVWLIDGSFEVIKTGGTWSTNSSCNLGYTGSTGGTITSPYGTTYWFTDVASNLLFQFPSKFFIATNTDRTSQIMPYFTFNYTTAGTSTYSGAFQITKIA